jgi:hypothetical protein
MELERKISELNQLKNQVELSESLFSATELLEAERDSADFFFSLSARSNRTA